MSGKSRLFSGVLVKYVLNRDPGWHRIRLRIIFTQNERSFVQIVIYNLRYVHCV